MGYHNTAFSGGAVTGYASPMNFQYASDTFTDASPSVAVYYNAAQIVQ